jgi:predicted RecA/RadA family phage recombinase
MATNFIQPGDVVTVVAPYAVNSGDGVKVGQIFGFATKAALSAANVEVKRTGVVTLAKTNAVSTSAAQGANIHWDDSGRITTISSTSNLKIGVAMETTTNTQTTVKVLLTGTV